MGVLPDNEDEGAFQKNLTCLNSIVHMLHSIPEVAELFEEQSFKSDIHITDICDEIHRMLKLNTDAADLRVALGPTCSSPSSKISKWFSTVTFMKQSEPN